MFTSSNPTSVSPGAAGFSINDSLATRPSRVVGGVADGPAGAVRRRGRRLGLPRPQLPVIDLVADDRRTGRAGLRGDHRTRPVVAQVVGVFEIRTGRPRYRREPYPVPPAERVVGHPGDLPVGVDDLRRRI